MDISSWFSNGIGVLDRGGPVMYALLVLSVLALTIILVKVLQFAQLRLRRLGFVEASLAHLARGDADDARAALGEIGHPVARVMAVAIETARDAGLSEKDREAEIGRIGSNQVRRLETLLRGLEIIASISPLLGLLGTIFGMIKAFAKVEEAGANVDPSLLAGGIWEALLTTAFGLTIGIPALAAFHLLEGRVDRTRAAMRDAVIRVNTGLGRGRTEA